MKFPEPGPYAIDYAGKFRENRLMDFEPPASRCKRQPKLAVKEIKVKEKMGSFKNPWDRF